MVTISRRNMPIGHILSHVQNSKLISVSYWEDTNYIGRSDWTKINGELSYVDSIDLNFANGFTVSISAGSFSLISEGRSLIINLGIQLELASNDKSSEGSSWLSFIVSDYAEWQEIIGSELFGYDLIFHQQEIPVGGGFTINRLNDCSIDIEYAKFLKLDVPIFLLMKFGQSRNVYIYAGKYDEYSSQLTSHYDKLAVTTNSSLAERYKMDR